MSAPLPNPPNAAALRALVLDERPAIRDRVCAILTEAGMRSFDLGSTLGSTSIMARRQIDIVIVGSDLAGKNADRFVQMLRNNPRRAHLKIIRVVADEADVQADHEADVVVEERDLERSLISVVHAVMRQSSVLSRT